MSEIDIYWLRAKIRGKIHEEIKKQNLDRESNNPALLAYLCGINKVCSILADITGIEDWYPQDF